MRWGLGVVTGVLVAVTAARAEQTGTVQVSFTAAQAQRGAAAYGEFCRGCHGSALEGTEFGPALTGPAFAARWSRRRAGDLFDVLQTTMPLNSPGGLSAAQNADLFALLLQRSGATPGTVAAPAESRAFGDQTLGAAGLK